jgi:hypothetical protein
VRGAVARFLGVALLLWPAGAGAQVYRWVDEQGTIHFSSGIERVPERHRDGARSLQGAGEEPSPGASGSGVARILFTPGAPILVGVRINGAGPLTLVLDTGADRTLVAPDALRALGIGGEAGARAEVRGVAGVAQADVVEVSLIEVAGARVGPLRIIAHDAAVPQAQGLLGRDFLGRFHVTIDSQAGVVTLAPP